MDRRVKKTRRAIVQAFLMIVKDSPVNKISISELAELADINRKTFYLHFSDIYDLEKTIQKKFVEGTEELKEYFNFTKPVINEDNFIDILFDKLVNVSVIFKEVIHTEFFHNMLREAVENLKKILIAEYIERGGTNERKFSYAYTFIANGIVELFLEWAQTESHDDRQLIKDILYYFIDFSFLSRMGL